jgi:hypothetical protein
MTNYWMIISSVINKSWIFIIGFIGFFLYRKNKQLNIENSNLKDSQDANQKIINIQNKVLNASENIKPTDLNGIIKRMRDKKL